MAAYILFKNISIDDINTVMNFLNGVYKNSMYGPNKEEAIGVCTTEYTQQYTYLNDYMCNKTNPYISWIMCRKEYNNINDFMNAVKDEIEEYNVCYKNFI